MRTTLSLDDDVLTMARAIAGEQDRTLGEVVSDLARRSLQRTSVPRRERNGLLLVPAKPGVVVTSEHVAALRDEEP